MYSPLMWCPATDHSIIDCTFVQYEAINSAHQNERCTLLFTYVLIDVSFMWYYDQYMYPVAPPPPKYYMQWLAFIDNDLFEGAFDILYGHTLWPHLHQYAVPSLSCTYLHLHCPGCAPTFTFTVLVVHLPSPSLSWLCTYLHLHCPVCAPTFTFTVLVVHLPSPSLSWLCTYLHLHCPGCAPTFTFTVLFVHLPSPSLSWLCTYLHLRCPGCAPTFTFAVLVVHLPSPSMYMSLWHYCTRTCVLGYGM